MERLRSTVILGKMPNEEKYEGKLRILIIALKKIMQKANLLKFYLKETLVIVLKNQNCLHISPLNKYKNKLLVVIIFQVIKTREWL